jgi:hypothetical protein
MRDDFSKYESMKQAGSSPEEVYRAAVRDGVDNISMFRLIRSVFAMSLTEAKEVIVRGQGWANSLEEYHDQIADILEAGEEQKAEIK